MARLWPVRRNRVMMVADAGATGEYNRYQLGRMLWETDWCTGRYKTVMVYVSSSDQETKSDLTLICISEY